MLCRRNLMIIVVPMTRPMSELEYPYHIMLSQTNIKNYNVTWRGHSDVLAEYIVTGQCSRICLAERKFALLHAHAST